MFIWTARIRPKRLLAAALALVLLAGGVYVFAQPDDTSAAATPAMETQHVKSNDDRLDFLARCGWQVQEEPLAMEEMLIPNEFDASYDQYLALQSGQGFDLTKYCGKRVKRYAYQITNYPSGEEGVQVGILIYKDQVIGGEVLSPALDGFIHGLVLE